MVSAIFTDIDGTLLHDDLTIGRKTAEALREASGRGILIALASGRYPASLFRIEERLSFPVMKVAVNGAIIMHGGQFIEDIRISE